MIFKEWLSRASQTLKNAGIKSYSLDSELILAKVLKKNRTFLHSNPSRIIHKTQLFHANNWLNKRSKRIPLAYIFGEKEFYGRNFLVTKDTLTPRPESEEIIELYKKIVQENDWIIDVGTGSGILAITAFLESSNFNNLKFYASDMSAKALEIAHNNADILDAEINFLQNDLLENLSEEITEKLTIIIANLPYVDKSWISQTAQNELHHEPQNALYADDGGLEIIKKLIQESSYLQKIKYLILEADPIQHNAIISYAKNYGFECIEIEGFALALKSERPY